MRNSVWQKTVKECADPPRARDFMDKLLASSAAPTLKKYTADQARILLALLSGSQASAELLLLHPDWLATSLFDPDYLKCPRQKQGLRREVDLWLLPLLQERGYPEALARLRQFKQREMLRIATRDLARIAALEETLLEISNIADVCLEDVFRLCFRQLCERFGQPYHQDAEPQWLRTEFCVIGLGKLGGHELNYSSDIDVVFVYSEEGTVFKIPPTKAAAPATAMSNHQFFTRLAEAIIAEVSRLGPDGTLFRIDLRLRPEGNAGRLVRSLGSYENYYAQSGQTWERMMLMKARGVAGNTSLAGEFLEMTQTFRYPRSLGERTLQEVAAMKSRIETEVVKDGELDRHVKLGRGGIREVEFIAQTLQLLNAGRIPFLQEPRTLAALEKLVQYNLLQSEDALDLTRAYCFLRNVEHRLQMEANLQTHTIPTEPAARARLAALMGFGTVAGFETALREHTGRVRRVYDKLLKTDLPPIRTHLPAEFQGAKDQWFRLLAEASFRDPEKAFRLLELFVQGPGYIHVSSRTVELGRDLITRLLKMCPKTGSSARAPSDGKWLSDPDRVLARLDSFVQAYGARATLFETWVSNPSLFDLLLLLFDRSEFLAEVAIRVPDLVDDLVLSGRLRRAKTSAEILKDLRHGLADPDQRLWIRRYHQAEFMRLGLRDILGLVDFEQNLTELTSLADACLQYALEVVLKENQLSRAPFAIIGLGKLGGAELTYGSDLDVLFVTNARTKALPPLQGLAAKVLDLLSSQTELGAVFHTDARLRPDGTKGLLVNTLPAYEEYYRQRALLWEIQTLTRTRPIAGDVEVGERFRRLTATLTNFKNPSQPLAAYSPAWREEIGRMRQRIEKERVPAGKQALAFKTGAGGLVDAEFIAQTLCLANGWQEPHSLRALERAQQQKALPEPEATLLLDNYRKLRRIEGILRRWSYEGESEFPAEPEPQYRVAVRCGFANAEAFFKAVSEYRAAIRSVYAKVIPLA